MNGHRVDTLPDGLLVSWYGDDFTGSAAVMEVLTFAGLPCVLFLGIPTPKQLDKFSDMRGIGIAGTARSHSPGWMEKQLPEIFGFMQGLGARVQHYKVCSTLDSSPTTGSIGKAIDLAQKIFCSPWVPLFIAAPAIRRFQAFGNLFAASPAGIFRLDQHPVMARHPITPMDEANVVKHLQKQTDKPFGVVDLEQMQSELSAQTKLEKLRDGHAEILALDCVDARTLALAGRLIWENRDGENQSVFAVGSQGIEYALVAYWQESGALGIVPEPAGIEESDHIIVVSGSVSEVTAAQIDWALSNGFEGIAFDAIAAIAGGTVLEAAIDQTVLAAIKALKNGKDPIIFTALGPNDPQVKKFQQALSSSNINAEQANNNVGRALGDILATLLHETDISRAVICGGDTSGHATRQLSIFALSAIAPTIPGAALFSAHSDNPKYQNLQLALKGGQMGSPDYFGWIKKGGGAQNQTRNLS